MQSDQKADILHRLRCASGHLIVVTQMVESETPCDQVMYQLKAVEAALRIVARKLITCQAESIQAVILKSSSEEERMAELYHPNLYVRLS